MSTQDQHPVGQSAPTDLAGLTPSALNARESTKQRQTESELAQRSELKEILFRLGDASILPSLDVSDRCGGAHQCPFAVSEAPGWRVAMEVIFHHQSTNTNSHSRVLIRFLFFI
jgi:hypothetical protein